jgi:hypothetical protein
LTHNENVSFFGTGRKEGTPFLSAIASSFGFGIYCQPHMYSPFFNVCPSLPAAQKIALFSAAAVLFLPAGISRLFGPLKEEANFQRRQIVRCCWHSCGFAICLILYSPSNFHVCFFRPPLRVEETLAIQMQRQFPQVQEGLWAATNLAIWHQLEKQQTASENGIRGRH